jgi:hypothetical protein
MITETLVREGPSFRSLYSTLSHLHILHLDFLQASSANFLPTNVWQRVEAPQYRIKFYFDTICLMTMKVHSPITYFYCFIPDQLAVSVSTVQYQYMSMSISSI